MEMSNYKKALEIVIEKESLTVSELLQELIKLNIPKKEALSIINEIIESPLIKYTADLIQIV